MGKQRILEEFKKDKKIIDLIEEECKKNDINIYDVIRISGLDKNTVYNWNHNEPKSFKTLKTILKTIETLKKGK